jgi:hypothetical protein
MEHVDPEILERSHLLCTSSAKTVLLAWQNKVLYHTPFESQRNSAFGMAMTSNTVKGDREEVGSALCFTQGYILYIYWKILYSLPRRISADVI